MVLQCLAAGHECSAIGAGDALATYGWYSTTTTHFTDDLSVHFGRQWVYMHGGFTHPRTGAAVSTPSV